MADTQTSPASVASRMTDNEILKLAENHTRIDSSSLPKFVIDRCRQSAAVLRDYVRLRKLANVVKAKTNEILRNEDGDGPFELVTGNGPMWIRDTSNRMQGPAVRTAVDAINAFVEIKHLLGEAELTSEILKLKEGK